MSKFRLDNPKDTPLDPFAFEKQFAKPETYNPSPYTGTSSQLEFVADKVDEGYGTMGNSSYAQQVINEKKVNDQGSLELLGKGLFNVVKTIGIEVAKTPGYAVGMAGAIGNEVFGDGKNSMEMIVDNAWVNAFEKLDDAAKEAMPVYMSQQVQEGGLLGKMGSGAWWATTGADGLGFMLAMFAPGAAAKAFNIGTKIASGAEALGNLSPRLGKMMTGANMLEQIGESSFALSKSFARNANGYSSAVINTALESSAEAANTFDNVKGKYMADGLSEEEAKSKAGEAAAAVFKGNMALLAVSNVLDEAWIWKSIGSAGEKEAAQSLISKLFKDGNIDMDVLSKLPKEFSKASVLKRVGQNFGKGVAKEGFFEEGTQTLLQQNIEAGKNKNSVLGNLSDVAASYLDDFANNSELHESIFLGGLLGGGASIIGTINENNALKGALYGSTARTKDNSFWTKYGVLPETKDQKGLNTILKDAHIAQFRSYKDLIDQQPDGSFKLNQQKLVDAQLEQVDNMRLNILYDLAVQNKDEFAQELLGQTLAANYVSGFVGQEGNKELFAEHVKNQVLPAWQQRFEETFGRPATAKESQEYQQKFQKSGERILNAYKQAEETQYPERYFSETSKEYTDYKKQYFHDKFQTLVNLNSVDTRRATIQQQMHEAGITENEVKDIRSIEDPLKRILASDFKQKLEEVNQGEQILKEQYASFFTKEGVKAMFEGFKSKNKIFEDAVADELKTKEELTQKVDALPASNEEELQRIFDEDENYHDVENMNLKDKDGNSYVLNQNPENGEYTLHGKDGSVEIRNYKGKLSDLKLEHDDVTSEEYKTFKDTGKAPESVINKIAKKLERGESLTATQQEIADANIEEINAAREKLQAASKAPIIEPRSEVSESDGSILDKAISEVEKKKGVNLYPSTGRNVKNELVPIGDEFIEELTDKPSQKLWFQTLEDEVVQNPQAYTVQVVRLDDKSNPELHQQIMRDADPATKKDGDLYTVLYKDGKPVLKEGNYVFTGLWRPDSLYPVHSNGSPEEFILAESAILENFKRHVGLPKLNLDRLSKKDKDTLDKFGIKDATKTKIREAAFFHAKKEYSEWYQNLQDNPSQLQVAGVTNGHAVKKYTDKKGQNPSWENKPLKNIPGLKLETSKNPKSTDLTGGRLELAIFGNIKVNGEEVKVAKGDVVIVDNQNNVHPMRARTLDANEALTVLYLLSLRADTNQPTETIKIKPDSPIRFGNEDFVEVPVFYNGEKSEVKGQSRKNLIDTLISFGSKDGSQSEKKGEIYFNQQSIVDGNPVLVWTDFNGETHNIEVSKIKEAVDKNDFDAVASLVDFLQQKKFNVNEHLLGSSDKAGNPLFNKPTLVYKDGAPTLSWDNSRSYFDHLLNDVLTTTTAKVEGYPNRVQRNAWFDKEPIKERAFDDTVWENPEVEIKETTREEVAPVKRERRKATKTVDDFMDKVLTTSDLLKAKIQSGEILQNCK